MVLGSLLFTPWLIGGVCINKMYLTLRLRLGALDYSNIEECAFNAGHLTWIAGTSENFGWQI